MQISATLESVLAAIFTLLVTEPKGNIVLVHHLQILLRQCFNKLISETCTFDKHSNNTIVKSNTFGYFQ